MDFLEPTLTNLLALFELSIAKISNFLTLHDYNNPWNHYFCVVILSWITIVVCHNISRRYILLLYVPAAVVIRDRPRRPRRTM
jgi:hypothetical protein